MNSKQNLNNSDLVEFAALATSVGSHRQEEVKQFGAAMAALLVALKSLK